MKHYLDYEGFRLTSASVYVDGRRVGVWSQDEWGGPDRFEGEHCENLVCERAAIFAEGYPSDAPYAFVVVEPECFMGQVVDLYENEQTYKKAVKKGCKALAICTDWHHIHAMMLPKNMTLKEFEEQYPDDYRNLQDGMFQNVELKLYIINALNDLDITVDATHPVPDYMVRR